MIELRGITVQYANGVTALENVSLTFAAGQFTVLLGPSGAGKSTLLRCLNGLIRPGQGTIRADDAGVLFPSGPLRAHRRRTGMIFQHHHLIGRHTALQNVLVGRLGHHPAWRTLLPLPAAERRFALACLDRVGLLDKALRRAETLSGGERQRVGVARALAQQPRLILADEPVASLDPAAADRVLGLLRRICQEDGITAVVSLHQLGLARTYADRIIGLSGGRTAFDGPPERLDTAALAAVYPTIPATTAPPHPGWAHGVAASLDLAPREGLSP